MVKRSWDILEEFFSGVAWYIMQQKMRTKTRYFNMLINFMQRRMKDKCATIDAKIDVMRLAWDKSIFTWSRKATMYKDDGMKLIMESIKCVRPEIVRFLLRAYVRQCKKRHAIAFFQWRIHFSLARKESNASCQLETEEVLEILNDRIAFFEKESSALLQSFNMTDQTVEVGAFTPIRNPKQTYDLGHQSKASFHIKTFQSIGWPDPFP